MRKTNYIWGILMIALGGLLLSENIFDFSLFSPMLFLPMLILGLGLSFEAAYFINKRYPGLLVPGGILTTIGFLFFFEVTTNWQFANLTWPIYVLSVAVGLFQFYLFSGRPKGLLIPVIILLAVAGSFLSMNILSIFNSWSGFKFVISVILIVLGINALTRKRSVHNEWK